MFKRITKKDWWGFEAAKTGIYAIEVKARVKSGKILGIWGGEDLKVEIDFLKFREIPPKGRVQYYNIPSAWNGTDLKGSVKVIVFILKLEKGHHEIKFFPKKGAVIEEEPKISLISDPKKFFEVFKDLETEERNRQPWASIVLTDLSLKILDVSVSCEKRSGDSDDVKLIVDGVD